MKTNNDENGLTNEQPSPVDGDDNRTVSLFNGTIPTYGYVHCAGCGVKNHGANNFCIGCGARLGTTGKPEPYTTPPPPPPPPPTPPTLAIIAIATACIIILIFVLLLLINPGSCSKTPQEPSPETPPSAEPTQPIDPETPPPPTDEQPQSSNPEAEPTDNISEDIPEEEAPLTTLPPIPEAGSRLRRLYDNIENLDNGAYLVITWIGGSFKGSETIFERDRNSIVWMMYGRNGDNREVFPAFEFDGNAFLISWPNTSDTRVYYLHESETGYFRNPDGTRNEDLTWEFWTH